MPGTGGSSLARQAGRRLHRESTAVRAERRRLPGAGHCGEAPPARLAAAAAEDSEPTELHRRRVDVVHEKAIVTCVDRRRSELLAVLEQRIDVVEHGTIRPHG